MCKFAYIVIANADYFLDIGVAVLNDAMWFAAEIAASTWRIYGRLALFGWSQVSNLLFTLCN
jgi:hypothetical protein